MAIVRCFKMNQNEPAMEVKRIGKDGYRLSRRPQAIQAMQRDDR